MCAFVGPLISAPSTECGDDGFVVDGAKLQTMINGCYRPRDSKVNGYSSFQKSDVYLYWHTAHGGQWVISDTIGSGFRAFVPAKTGDAGPTVFPTWHTLDGTGKVSDAWPVGRNFWDLRV